MKTDILHTTPSHAFDPARRRALASMLAASAAMAGGASMPVWAQAARQKGGVLKVAALVNPSSLDPATGGAGTDHAYLWTLYDTLVEWDYKTLQTKPGLAEWAFPDPRTMVLTLRPGVKFHDGTACDAQAVKFNLDRNRQDARSNLKADLANISQVEVTGPLQVKVSLNQPDYTLPASLSDRAGMMVSPKAVRELGADHDRKPVGAGPWKFVKWADGQNVTLVRHEQYWRADQPYVDGIEFNIIVDNATALRSVVANQNHFVHSLSARYKPIIDRAKNLKFVTGPTLYLHQIYFNFARGALSNLKVRQAINFAIDRDAFLKAGMGGLGEIAHMQLPSAHWAYDKSLVGLYPFDPERARKLVAESGLSNIEIVFGGNNDQDSVRRNEIVMEQLGKVGIKTRFIAAPVAEAASQFFGSEKKTDALLSAWTGRPDPSMSYGSLYGTSAYFNAGRTEISPEFTKLLQESRARETLADRQRVFSSIQRTVMEGAYVAPLVFQVEVAAAAPQVRDFVPNLLGKPKFNDVWLAS
ncbi:MULTISPECIES: ABC transporter substrate-binding protein [unclassified Simplicispira]|uniref:ABC transporter substrate-binding protein n=1 Tax=unclassified Simplicispira TaxID=2630407 RepID=UPI000D5FA1D0|nr:MULTISPECIES: ABC transporter substrate-binding protein [unclassified Simplicispira]PVY55834.1 peptide/nickel transport system permease protein/peptide/nickel transport system substrate-binding protein [Simplicispira sp. 125]REG16777.1 peptide/nickel transport system permease protein/peptide/nickel transport system substrate-binding protein [Simplicispira sp. 110]